jgi:hypothetical protein
MSFSLKHTVQDRVNCFPGVLFTHNTDTVAKGKYITVVYIIIMLKASFRIMFEDRGIRLKIAQLTSLKLDLLLLLQKAL